MGSAPPFLRWRELSNAIVGHTQSLKPWTKGATACRGLTEQHWRNSIMEFCWKRCWIQSRLQRSQLYLPSNAIRRARSPTLLLNGERYIHVHNYNQIYSLDYLNIKLQINHGPWMPSLDLTVYDKGCIEMEEGVLTDKHVGCQQAIEEGISGLARSAVNLTVWDWWIFSNIFGAKCWLCGGRWVIYNHVSQCVVIFPDPVNSACIKTYII